MTNTIGTTLRALPLAARLTPYSPPPTDPRIRLKLDANEGRPPPPMWLEEAGRRLGRDANRYATPRRLEGVIADARGVRPAEVVVTAGGDEALDRVMRCWLEPGRRLVTTTPSFEMIAHYGRAAGAEVRAIEWWTGAFPVDAVLACAEPGDVVAVVSPNNPTGSVILPSDLASLATKLPETLIVLDLAYTEYAITDLAPIGRALPNVVTIRTFSKFFGLASLRVGYAIGPEAILHTLRAVGSPFPVSAFSLAAAEVAQSSLNEAPAIGQCMLEQIRAERNALYELFTSRGIRCLPSQANFVLAEVSDAGAVHEELLQLGISIRRFKSIELENFLRITLPGDSDDFEFLISSLSNSLPRHAL